MAITKTTDNNFIQALEQGNLALLQQIHKTDWHNHAALGGSREYIYKKTGVQIPHLDHRLASMADMHQWVDQNINDLFNSVEKREVAIAATFYQAQQDGVSVLEIGDDVWANDHFYQGNIETLIATFQRIHESIAPEIDFRFQIGLSRHCSIAALERWIAPFLEQSCFYSIDLYGDELAQPIENFKSIYRRAKAKGLVLKAHVGEWGNADSVKKAVEMLELDEVQHGIAAATSKEVMNWLSAQQIPLHICPSSNVMLNRVPELNHHPIRTLFDHGVKVTINSDDVLVFGQSVSQEYLNLYNSGLFAAQELNIIRKTGLSCAKPKSIIKNNYQKTP